MVHTLSVECVSPLAALFPRWPHVLGLLLPFEPDCILSMEYVSLWTKNTFYRSLCHSLNFFCKRHKRAWVSPSPKTRYMISIKRLWVQAPVWVAWFQWVTQFQIHSSWRRKTSNFKANGEWLKEQGEDLWDTQKRDFLLEKPGASAGMKATMQHALEWKYQSRLRGWLEAQGLRPGSQFWAGHSIQPGLDCMPTRWPWPRGQAIFI